jgi:hypothetical protein
MFSDLETFALILVAGTIERERQREHARQIVASLSLDPRLADFIPLPPRKRKLRPQYERLLVVLQEVSAMPEPKRSRTIDDVRVAAASVGWRA